MGKYYPVVVVEFRSRREVPLCLRDCCIKNIKWTNANYVSCVEHLACYCNVSSDAVNLPKQRYCGDAYFLHVLQPN